MTLPLTLPKTGPRTNATVIGPSAPAIDPDSARPGLAYPVTLHRSPKKPRWAFVPDAIRDIADDLPEGTSVLVMRRSTRFVIADIPSRRPLRTERIDGRLPERL